MSHLLRLATIVLSFTVAFAQFTQRSGLTGMVTDPSGAVIPNVTVTVTDLDRNTTEKATTNENGLYTFRQLTAGRYQVTVEQTGFRKVVSEPISIASQETARLDLTLQLGNVTETVEVESTAPLLQTEESVVGATVNQALVSALPMKGRNFTAMAALSPNISSFPRGNSGSTWNVGGHNVIAGVDYTVGGGGDNGFYMNGVNINENWQGGASYSPSVEAISEVRLDVANFSAASGRDVSTLQVSTKSGTNEFHGTGFDYFQNSALNAWNPYNKAIASPGQKKSLLQRNQYGFNVGGPVVIPKVVNLKDKMFFFFNYEGMRQNSGGEGWITRVPTQAELQGDYSSWLTRFPGDPNYLIYDPFSTIVDDEGNTTRTAFPGNRISGARLNADARSLLGMYPAPNGYVNPTNPEALENYQTWSGQRPTSFRIDSRVDFRISQNDSVYVNISRSKGQDKNFGGLFPDMPGNVDDRSYLLTANYARVFTPNLTNEFIFAYGKGQLFSVDQASQDYMRRTDTLRNQFFRNTGTGDDAGFHAIHIEGLPSIGFEEVFMASNPTLQFSDNVSWIRGKHQFKFGFSYFKKSEHDWDYIRSVYFGRTFSRAGNVDDSLGGDGLASFLMGLPEYINQRYDLTDGNSDLNLVMPYWSFFGEDKFQVTKNLTLSLGLRLELPVPQYSDNRYGNAVVDLSYPDWQLAIPGRASGLDLHYLPQPKNVAPRISLAYRTGWNTVIRASYGIFFNSGSATTGANNLDYAFASVPGYVGDEYYNARFGAPDDVPVMGWNDIFPTQTQFQIGTYPVSTGTGTGYFDYNAEVRYWDKDSSKTPYYQRYLFEVQKGFGSNTAVSLSYTGSRGTRLPMWDNVNQPAYRTGWTSTDVFNDARPNNSGRFADVWVMRHGLDSFYNSATVKVEQRMTRGLQFVTHYTFSKTVIENDMRYNRNLGRGEASFSHPHRLVAAVTYDMPWGQSLPSLAKAALYGWQVSTIATFESGNALNVGNSLTSARDQETNRPNVSDNPNLPRGERDFYRYFDTSVFSAPPQDVKGNAGLGILRGPGMNNWDITLSKVFVPTAKNENFKVEFRADMFNAFNHTQWSGVNTSYTNRAGNTFGRVTGAREPRIVQLGLRVRF